MRKRGIEYDRLSVFAFKGTVYQIIHENYFYEVTLPTNDIPDVKWQTFFGLFYTIKFCVSKIIGIFYLLQHIELAKSKIWFYLNENIKFPGEKPISIRFYFDMIFLSSKGTVQKVKY